MPAADQFSPGFCLLSPVARVARVTVWFATSLIAVAARAQPAISPEPRTQFQWENKRVSLNVGARGIPPFTYQWQLNGVDLSSATNASLVFNNVQLTNDGTYRVIVTESSG